MFSVRGYVVSWCICGFGSILKNILWWGFLYIGGEIRETWLEVMMGPVQSVYICTLIRSSFAAFFTSLSGLLFHIQFGPLPGVKVLDPGFYGVNTCFSYVC